jgi:hypothetical protein
MNINEEKIKMTKKKVKYDPKKLQILLLQVKQHRLHHHEPVVFTCHQLNSGSYKYDLLKLSE